MTDDRLEELIARHLDGVLDPAGETELAQRLADDPAAGDRLVERERFDRLIAATAGDGRDQARAESVAGDATGSAGRPGTAGPIRAVRHPRRRWVPPLVVAAGALLIALVVWPRGRWGTVADGAALAIDRGGVMLVAPPGTALRAGDRVSASAADGSIRSEDGAQLHLRAGTAVALAHRSASARLELLGGSLDAAVEPRAGRRAFAIAASHTVATVLGTRFTLGLVDGLTTLAVAEGEVRLSAAGHELTVRAGETASAAPGQPPTAAPARPPRSAAPGGGPAGVLASDDVVITTQELQWTDGNGVTSFDEPHLQLVRSDLYRTRALLRFAGVPRGARATAAELSLTVENAGGDVRLAGRYLRAPWAPRRGENGLGWRFRGNGREWAAPGATADGADVGGREFALDIAPTPRARLSVALDPAEVQRWVDDPATNHGLVLEPTTPGALRIHATRAADPADWPRLRITWALPP